MRSYKETPLFQKALEINETLRAIVALIPDNNDMLVSIKQQLMEDGTLISAKIAGAEGAKLYDLKMENAAFIRKAARDLMVSYHSLEMHGFKEVEYYKLVREQIEEFRLLFVDWVKEFDPKHFITDSWGLFNPPGISHDYEQSDDELDFLDDDDEDEW